MPTIALSPYHLTTREPPALAVAQLADAAVTMLPSPPSGRSGGSLDHACARRAADESPGYASFMTSWAWAAPLFREGVIGSVYGGEDAADDVRGAWQRLRHDNALGPLRPLMRDRLYDDDRSYLAALAGDILRGGPDPGVSIPVAAGLDAFAARHRLPVARAQGASMVQRIESRMATRLFTLALPMLVQAGSDRLLEARELFEPALEGLRGAIDDALDSSGHGERPVGAFEAAQLREAAGEYTRAFEAQRGLILGPGCDDEPRPVAGLVSIAAVAMPADAVLRSSLAAARALAVAPGPRPQHSNRPGPAHPHPHPHPHPQAHEVPAPLPAPVPVGCCVSLIVREVGHP